MKRELGLSIGFPNEAVFQSGYFDRVEYCKSVLETEDSMELVKNDVTRLVALSGKYGVKIGSFHVPFGNSDFFHFSPADLDEKLRAETFDNTKTLLDIIAPLQVEYIVVHGSLRVLPEERLARLDAFVEYVSGLADYCKPLGISVAVETLKPRCIGNSLKEHLYIAEKVNRKNLGICFDSNHLLEEDNLEFLRGAGEYVIATHLSDFDGIDERHWFPGKGINDWKAIVSVLEEKRYQGPYLFEVDFPDRKATKPLLDEMMTLWNAQLA